jgi:hypothetical protein
MNIPETLEKDYAAIAYVAAELEAFVPHEETRPKIGLDVVPAAAGAALEELSYDDKLPVSVVLDTVAGEASDEPGFHPAGDGRGGWTGGPTRGDTATICKAALA